MIHHGIHQRVCDEVKGMEEEIIRTVQDVVRIHSVVGNEADIQDYMEALYRSCELRVTRFQPNIEKLKGEPGFIDTGMSYKNRPNIIGTLEGDPDAPSLILSGHVDVVSPEPVGSWTHDPWGGEKEGDRIYGRGAGDMKSGLIANFYALESLKRARMKPKGTVMLHSVIDEEAGGAGGQLACLAEGYTADGIICTEPHNLNITIACAGVCYFRVKVTGKTSHAGLGHLGVNAIGNIIPIYEALVDLDAKRGVKVHFNLFEKGSGRSCHLVVGTLKAGDWPSTVPGSAEMECRISFVPGEKREDIKHMIVTLVNEVAQQNPWLRKHAPQIEWFGWQADPWFQVPGHPFITSLKEATKTVLGHEASYVGRAAGLDVRFSQYFKMAGACTGPVAGNIHGIDEYVEIPSVIKTAQILASTILNWCGYIQ